MKEPQIYRRHNGFQPASRLAQEFYDKMAGQDFVELVGKKLRNPTYHRRFWPKLNLVVENSDRFKTIDQLRLVIMAGLGRGEWVKGIPGTQPIFVPDSIAFDKMDQIEFEKLVNDFANIIMEHFLPVGRSDIEEEIARM